jgi:hypothetical protein
MAKLVPALVSKFDFVLQSEEWETVNYWFVKPGKMRVGVRVRER